MPVKIIVDLELLAKEVEDEVREVYLSIEKKALKNHAKVLEGFRRWHISDYHLKGSTGYGYGDAGREALERVYAEIFRAEAALVRGQIVSGTHAIALCLYGILRPGDELLFIQGEPYDTLSEMIGIRGEDHGSLKEFGINYRQVGLVDRTAIDYEAVGQAISDRTRMVMLQRSRGYSLNPSLSIREMKRIINFIRDKKPDTIIFVDNCYGEFVEEEEPIEAGADLAAGSLIKNPGGGIAATGGYVVGKAQYVQMASNRWTAPGIGAGVGPTLEHNRLLFQGLFLAPHVVAEALKGAVFASRFFERLGFEVMPRYDEERHDIVQAIRLDAPERMLAFCRGIQACSPVDSHVVPEASTLPGYGEPVVMAAGTFIQGASLELSADGPIRPPYVVYLQGGLSKEYVRLAVISAAREVLKV
ncbi:MAG: methionine gamma-lyase family protein [Syntrophothermus sp.]|uniref:Cystathionine beta-lyase family protein n=1 Tax=Pelotomaculum thermopropionicum (strain DSM 13744 / JCM 10971 / SI) TaxID=370438 RepID=A5D2L0_PELTS|nr:methionine gamma-lyase family protein [Syntrophothermus sp.]NSW82496.1 methionine gamma-lyase family protein [Syntrophothermus sp.]BAF59528.1 cystathionine beta-lyase family protein [Pelotomaculum thermopropionicum SI]